MEQARDTYRPLAFSIIYGLENTDPRAAFRCLRQKKVLFDKSSLSKSHSKK